MVSDREVLEAMFTRAGIVWSSQHPNYDSWPEPGIASELYVCEKTLHSGANRGYTDFYTRFGFDERGALVYVGAWE